MTFLQISARVLSSRLPISDIKPDNMLIKDLDDSGWLVMKLGDFGSANLRGDKR